MATKKERPERSTASARAENKTVVGAYEITTPNPNYSGAISGIVFTNGRAVIPVIEPYALRKVLICRDMGYKVRLIDHE